MFRKSVLPALSAVVLLAAGCSGDGGSTDPQQPATLSSADIDVLAERVSFLGWATLNDGYVDAGLGASIDLIPARRDVAGTRQSLAPTPVNLSFTRTRQCPKGGSTTAVATVTGQNDAATRSVSTTTAAIKTDKDCAYQGKDVSTITINGDPNVALTAKVNIVNGVSSGPQVSTQKGAIRWSTNKGKSGTCEVDLTTTIVVATKTHTVAGTMCGKSVSTQTNY